eukprot:COSAG06_NODE_50831_length_316_cov_0.589862_2_plen_60_part_01
MIVLQKHLPHTQTAYQSGKSYASNVMWVQTTIGQILALGRTAVLPLLDASAQKLHAQREQ